MSHRAALLQILPFAKIYLFLSMFCAFQAEPANADLTTRDESIENLTSGAQVTATDSSWKNFFAVAWHNSPQDHIRYAKQMGYDYIGINNLATAENFNWIADRAGLKFYLVDPQYNNKYAYKGYSRKIPFTTTDSVKIKFFNDNMAWKSNASFPYNLATGWCDGKTANDSLSMWDFQQQKVIDYVVENIILAAKSLENTSIGFTFAGVIFDVPRLYGDFHYWKSETECPFTRLSNWTGSDSSLLHSGVSHEYSTYQDGLAAFFKRLNLRMKEVFPNAKWIIEPGKIFNTDWVHADGWVEELTGHWNNNIARWDKNQLVPDFLSQEHPGLEFVNDSRIFNSGVNITKDMVGSTQQLYNRTDVGNRLIAANAAINGSWYNWFGRMGVIGIDTIENVAPRLKLIRVIPNWDNLSSVPLSSRSWNGSVYQSSRSYADGNVIYSRHWKTGKLFAVFNNHNGVIKLKAGETVKTIRRASKEYFEESSIDGNSDVTIVGSEIRLKTSVNIPIDGKSNEPAGVGYIISLSSSSSDSISPKAPTGLRVEP